MSHRRRSRQKPEAIALGPECLKALAGMQSVAVYEPGTMLFREGQPAHGVYVLQSGRARLCIGPCGSSQLPLRVAGPGYLLGLPAVISNEPFGFSAKVLETAQVGFIHRDELLPFIRSQHELCLHLVQMLGAEVESAYSLIRAVRRGDPLPARNIA